MVCLAPRGPGESVGPRRLSAVVVRPLNFTVRSHLGKFSVAKSPSAFDLLRGMRALVDSVVLQASSVGEAGVRVRLAGALIDGVARAEHVVSRRRRVEPHTPSVEAWARFSSGVALSVADVVPHAHSGDL